MRKKDRKWRLRQQAPGRATQDQFPQTRMSVGPHDEQIRGMGRNVCFEDLADGSALGVDPVQHDVDTVPGKVLRQLFGGMLSVQMLLVENGDDANLLRLFQQRDGVGYGARGRAAEIPSHRDSPWLERAGSWTIRQDQGRLARAEYHSLGVPSIV